jgi:VWFA-related protein
MSSLPVRLKILLLATLIGGLVSVPSQARQSPEPMEQKFRITSDTVLVDLVVRDKNGRPVRDLQPGEVELFEDGKKQEIVGFRLIDNSLAVDLRREAPAAAAETAPETASDFPAPRERQNLITLVFESISQGNRSVSAKAALDLIDRLDTGNSLVAVFRLDRRLLILQPFTRDKAALRGAVQTAVSGTGLEHRRQAEEMTQWLEQSRAIIDASAGADVSVPGTGGMLPPEAPTYGDIVMARMVLNMLRLEDALRIQSQGTSSLYGLLSLVKEQSALPGRKTVLYFAEGLEVPPNLADLFRSLIGEANRAQVSFYGVDARALDTTDAAAVSAEALYEASGRSRQRQLTYGIPVSREEVMFGEKVESIIRSDVQGTLRTLSQNTGGFLLANSNDLRPAIREVHQDLGSYYELAYTPADLSYDGGFREITVKISRPDVSVQARSGYFALPQLQNQPVLPYEGPLLVALNAARSPRHFDYRAKAMRFSWLGRAYRYTLAVEIPLSSFRIAGDAGSGIWKAHFALMALLKDASGQIIEKFSQEYPLQGDVADADAIRRGNVVFLRHLELAPGRYSLETAAYEYGTDRASVRRSVLVVPDPPGEIASSSLLIVKRAEPAPEGDDQDSPLVHRGLRVLPNLGDPISPSSRVEIPVYLAIYMEETSPKPGVVLQLSREGQIIAQAAVDLPEPDDRGDIHYFGSFFPVGLTEGQYLVKAIIRTGDKTVEESTTFRYGQ